MSDVTIIIPIGPYHEEQAQRAIQSAKAQTIPVIVDPVHDTEGYGPGWARNVGIDRCTTPYIIFLDADDWLEDRAAELFLFHARSYPGHYIYSDWWVGEDLMVEAPDPCDAWRGGTVNNLTSLIPTGWAREVMGFDQELPGGEDTDFFLKLISRGCCGIRVDAPLVHYSPEGRRSTEYKNRPDFAQIHRMLGERYAGKMGCCDDRRIPMENEQGQPGDVWAVPQWGGNQNYTGRATGRRYGRQGNGNHFLCDPRDVEASRRPLQLAYSQVGQPDLRTQQVTQPIGQGGQPVPQVTQAPLGQRRTIHGAQELGTAMFGRVSSGGGAKYTPPNAVTQRPTTIDQIQRMALEDEDEE